MSELRDWLGTEMDGETRFDGPWPLSPDGNLEFKHYFFALDLCPQDHFDAVMVWCEENFGPSQMRWSYSMITRRFYFAEDNDAFAFKMRWV